MSSRASWQRLVARCSVLFVTFLGPSASAAEVRPESPVPRDTLVYVKPAEGEKVWVFPWFGPDTVAPDLKLDELASGELCFVGPPGRYALLSTYADGRQDERWVQIIDSVPPGPQPPTPGPGPGPAPTPTPPEPSVVPFPADSLTTIIVREGQTLSDLPPAQQQIFSSPVILKYLAQHVGKTPDGDPAVRIWDDDYTDAQLANTSEVLKVGYRQAIKDSKGQLPWIIISDGKQGTSQPLPANVADTLELLRKYGGN